MFKHKLFKKIITILIILNCLLCIYSCNNNESLEPQIIEKNNSNNNESIESQITQENNKIPLSEQEIIKIYDKSVFKIEILNKNKQKIAQGTGFFIKEDGTFVTNAHVVENAWYGKIKLDTYVGEYEIKEVVEYNENRDLFIGKINNFGLKFTPIKINKEYKNKDKIFSIGYPQDSYKKEINKGIINDTNYKYKNNYYIKNNAYINHGSSGGILSNVYGEVIGITTCSFTEGSYGAIPSNVFEYEMNNNFVHFSCMTLQEKFHPSKKIYLSSYNFDEYFVYEVLLNNVIFSTPNSAKIYYSINFYPKNYNLEIDNFSINVNLDIKINYTYSINYEYLDTQYFNTFETIYEYVYLYESNNFTYNTRQSYFLLDYSGEIFSIDNIESSLFVTGTIIEYD